MDIIQNMVDELELGAMRDEQLVEKIDEVLESYLHSSAVVGSGRLEPTDGDTIGEIDSSVLIPNQSIRDVVKRLDGNLDFLCEELADIVADDLTPQIITLRHETGELNEAISAVARVGSDVITHQTCRSGQPNTRAHERTRGTTEYRPKGKLLLRNQLQQNCWRGYDRCAKTHKQGFG
ncbi:hypothetical protein K439DRAFT_162910 [Ramaria rubella]|nr:hypothetical protein K439DRAFT_162910 [Ramaria rubella]